MSAILLFDNENNILSHTAKQLTSAGYDFVHLKDYAEASSYLRLNKPKIRIIVFGLENSLGYPTLRKLKRDTSTEQTLLVASNSDNATVADWVKKQNIELFFTPKSHTTEFLKHVKRSLYKIGLYFSHQQLNTLITALSKYTDSAPQLVHELSNQSKSIQELEHKLARRLTGIEQQRKFLAEVQG